MTTSQPPTNIHHLPGTAIILSRLPAQDWFSVEEAARYSGWGRTFVRERCAAGELPAQECKSCNARRSGKNSTYRIHVDDLVLFIMRNSRGKYADAKLVSDVAYIVRQWPAGLQRGLMTYLSRKLPAQPEAGSHVNGTVARAQAGTVASSPGGELAAIS